ncbi:MAG: protein-glutamate O-methyltransferase CheR [Myxococcota bacterium]
MTVSLIPVADLKRVSTMCYRETGIRLGEQKRRMVTSRLRQLVGSWKAKDYSDLLDRSEKNPDIQLSIVDALTTNETYFFREPEHFDVLERLLKQGAVSKIWCAAASTGEEPYSLGMVVREICGDRASQKILATDIAPSVLEFAHKGVYGPPQLRRSPPRVKKHLVSLGEDRWQVHRAVRRLLHFAQLNLMGPWPMKGPFDLISIRNVMIYFDEPTRQWLSRRLAQLLRPGGTLFIGHAETLGTSAPGYDRIQPAVYRRNNDPVAPGPRPAVAVK